MSKLKRKTVSIKSLVERVNKANASTADNWKDEREGNNRFLEQILHDAGAYRGFGYLSARELEGDAMSVGIREQHEDGTWNFDDTDHTRVKYSIATGL